MTIEAAIARFDTLYPNAFSFTEKLTWLSELDGMIYSEILSRYKGAPEEFRGYDTKGDMKRRLLAEFPYDDIYIKYLCLKADMVNSDIGRYNNSAALFNSSFSGFAAAYNREHEIRENIKLKRGED